MSFLAPVRTASGGIFRHKVQAFVLTMVLLISTASATLGLALLEANNGPWTRAFNAQDGAHLTLDFAAGSARGARGVSSAQLDATAHAAGVAAAAGPFLEVPVNLDYAGQPWGAPTLTGRASPSSPVDNVVVTEGHWVTGPGQIVLDNGPAPPGSGGPELGGTFQAVSLPGKPSFTIVGFANSITNSAFGWVTPAQATTLQALYNQTAGGGGSAAQGPVGGKGPGYTPLGGSALPPVDQAMLYRFSSASTQSELSAGAKAIVGTGIPASAILYTDNWLTQQQRASGNGQIMEPFIVAFALIGLIMAVLIVFNVVSGAIAAQYYRIGVLKSLGMTPGQVIAVYLNRIGWPALVGCVLGVVLGKVLSIPILSKSARAYGVAHQSVPPWVLFAAPLAMLALTMLSAFGPALRAGRLSATQAIAAGRAPAAGRGYLMHRLLAKAHLPRQISLGLAAPFARPGRTLVTLFAIAFGATAVIFAIGLSSSLNRVQQTQSQDSTVPVQIQQNGAGPPAGSNGSPSQAQNNAVTAALAATPGAAHTDIQYYSQVTVPAVPDQVNVNAFTGDSSWQGWTMIKGTWYTGPGQIVVNTRFLTDSGLAVGDTTPLNAGSTSVTVKIVGEVFKTERNPQVLMDAATLPGLATAGNLSQWNIGLARGTSVSGYIASVNNALGSSSPWAAISVAGQGGGTFFIIALALIGLLSLMVAVASALGVLNTVLMTTRDKVHDLGIFKAIGMRPGQMLVMVCCWVLGPGILAAILSAPAGVELNTVTLHKMGSLAGTDIPAGFTAFSIPELALLSLAALVLAIVGALLPATWAARARPAVALRTE
jgi:putative ABC transport system permease protein